MAKRGKAEEPVPEVYKPSEVAKMLRVDLRTVYGMIERGELPQIKAGRVIRIPRGPVDTLLGLTPATVRGRLNLSTSTRRDT